MDDRTEITVNKASHYQPVALLGLDEHGRQQYMCPFCHEVAYFDENGRGVCPTDTAMSAFLSEAMARLDTPTTEVPACFGGEVEASSDQRGRL